MNKKQKLEEEKRFLLEKQKTHWCTLAGWIPKVEVMVLSGKIAHKTWLWKDGDGFVEMQGPLAFLMKLSGGCQMDRGIDGKSEEELCWEYVGERIYCDYCLGAEV